MKALIFPMFSILVGVLLFGIWSNIHVYAQQSSSSSSSPPSSTSMPPSPSAAKVKITSPTKSQQVPVGKDLTISGTSIDNATSNDCKVSVIANKVRPYQPATAIGPGGVADYSKWKFDITSKYTTIKLGGNRITAKYECANNAALTSFSSVNVTGVQQGTGTTTAGTMATNKSTTATTPSTATTTTSTAAKTQISSSSSSLQQQTTTPKLTTKAAAAAPKQQQQIATTTNNNNAITPSASQLPKQNGNTGVSKETTATNLPVVLRPLSGGGCPSGYHLVSEATCIKDIKPTTTIPTRAPTTAATVAPVSNLSNRSSSSSSSSSSSPLTIVPQVNTINNQQQQLPITSNSSAVQNYTFASTSSLPGPGKLVFLGFHANSTGSTDSALTGKTSTSDGSHSSDNNHGSSSNDNKKSSSDSKSSSGDSNGGSKSSSSSSKTGS